MLVKEIMSQKVALLQPGDTMRDALALFQATGLDAAPVVDDDARILGIFTRSRLYQGLLETGNLDGGVGNFMKTGVITVDQNTSFETVAQKVKTTEVGQAVVTTGDGRIVGMLTKADVIRGLLSQKDLLLGELGTVLDSMHNGIFAIDQQCTMTILNPAAERCLGLNAGEALGRPIQSVLPESDLPEVLASGEARVGRKQSLRSVTVVSNSTPICVGGIITGATTIFQDLTEYEAVARRLESVSGLHKTLDNILALAYEGIVVVDGKGAITMANKAMADFTGLCQEALVGQPVSSVMDGTCLPMVARTGTQELAQVQVVRGRKVLVSCLPIIEEGRVSGAVGKITFRGLEEIREIARRIETLESRVAYYQEELSRFTRARYTLDHIVSASHEMARLKEEARRAAMGNSTVLLQGETGTGKELFAQALHNASPRRLGPFIKVNCAAIPPDLLESEFFGYAEGAFTGARKGGKPGKFELADGGTLFLDEVGDMSPNLQAKILRVLEDREFERVGGTEVVRVDVRVIAASNRDLGQLVAQQAFREDLYYRLNVVALTILPLRHRKEDILPLANHFIEKLNRQMGMEIRGVSPDALSVLQAHDWPGNVRELENAIERAVNLGAAYMIERDHLPAYLVSATPVTGGEQAGYRASVEAAERDAIVRALEASGGNKSLAARHLGVSRSTLYQKMQRLSLKT
ncbi:MAG: sigma-54-dependent Fis family transcriptional regulator [Bacillota bacterium]